MSKKLFVGGLSWGTTEAELKACFAEYGTVTEAKIIYDRETQKSRGFGFVAFENEEDAEKAQGALHDTELNGRKIRVDQADTKNGNRRSPGGGQDARGGNGGAPPQRDFQNRPRRAGGQHDDRRGGNRNWRHDD